MSTLTGRATEVDQQPSARDTRRRLWNALMAVLHYIAGVAMVILADQVLWPITRTRYFFNAETETIFP